MVKHPWPLLEISLSDFRRLATLNMITYLPTYLQKQSVRLKVMLKLCMLERETIKVEFSFKLHYLPIKLSSSFSPKLIAQSLPDISSVVTPKNKEFL